MRPFPLKRFLGLITMALATSSGYVPSAAAATTTVPFPVSVPDCQTSTELCAVIPTEQVTTSSVLTVDFTASPSHCSDIIVHILVDGVEKFVSGPLAPGVGTGVENLGPVSSGGHTVGIQAEGVIGGCNTGVIASWGGTLDITTSTATSTNVPTLSEWVMLILVAVMVGGAFLTLRHRRATRSV